MFMLALNCNNLVSNRVASPPGIRKRLISLTNRQTAVFVASSQSGKFLDTWSSHIQLPVKSIPPIRKKLYGAGGRADSSLKRK